MPWNDGELYRLLVRELKEVAIFMVDLDGRIVTWNVGVERILGFTESEFVGQRFAMVFVEEDVQSGVPGEELGRARKDGCSTDIRWHRRKDGSRIFADGVVTAVEDDSGAIVGFCKVLKDDTRRKLAEDALSRTNDELAQFAYVVSHDLQAPLRAVSSYAELLTKRYFDQLDTTGKEFVHFILFGAQQMHRLIADLLKYCKLSHTDAVPRSHRSERCPRRCAFHAESFHRGSWPNCHIRQIADRAR